MKKILLLTAIIAGFAGQAKSETAYFDMVYYKNGGKSGYYEKCKSDAYNNCFNAQIGQELCPINKGLLADGYLLDTKKQVVYLECYIVTGAVDYTSDITLQGGF